MKKNYLMEIIREEISSYLGENESMYDSPQTQQREVYNMLDQVENLKRLRADLDEQIAQLEAIANTFNVNELAFEVTGKNKKTVTSFKDKTTADAFGRENQVKVTPLEENSTNISISPNQIRSYITELIYSAEDMEYTPEMVKELKSLKAGLPRGKMSVESALDIMQQTINITEDDIDSVEALAQAVDYDDAIVDVARDIKGLNEETLNEEPFIDGPRGIELFNAIKTASEKLKNQFPDATPEYISKIIKNKKTQTKFAPEVEDALIAQEKKYGGDPNYTANLGPNQTLKAVAKALGEYEPGPRGRKAKEKGEAESKSGKDVPNKLGRKVKATPAAKTEKPAAEPKSKSFNKAPITKKNYEPKPVSDLTDDEGNPIEIDTTFKAATGNKELEDKLKDVIAKKKIKIAKAEGADYDREVAALKQFLAKPEIAKYIAKKTVNGVNPYSIDNILK